MLKQIVEKMVVKSKGGEYDSYAQLILNANIHKKISELDNKKEMSYKSYSDAKEKFENLKRPSEHVL
jgi:phage shock protein A